MQLMEDFKMMNLFQAPSPTSTSDCTWYNVLYSTVSNDVHKLACAQAWEQSVAVRYFWKATKKDACDTVRIQFITNPSKKCMRNSA